MFRIILILLPLLATNTLIFAQTLDIGFSAAFAVHNMDFAQGGTNINTKPVYDYQIAIPIEIGVADNFAIQPEIRYARHACDLADSDRFMDGDVLKEWSISGKIRLKSLEFPVLAKAKIPIGENAMFIVNAGPSIAYDFDGTFIATTMSKETRNDTVLLDQTTIIAARAKLLAENYDETALGNGTYFGLKKFQWNIHIGAGLLFKTPIANFFVEARFQNGLSDLFTDARGTYPEYRIHGKTKRYFLGVGCLVPIIRPYDN